MTDKISGGAFKQMVAFGAACITAQKQAINDLNVFPVPDGDTGTNMSLTIQTAVNELRKAEPATVDEAAKLTASGLLRGARGNSGVILSLLFRGMSKVLKGHAPAAGALRELREETGATPDEFIPMGKLILSPGCLGEELYLFLARGLHMGDTQPDEDEFLVQERIPFEEMVHRCVRGEIDDGKTVAAILKAKILLDL